MFASFALSCWHSRFPMVERVLSALGASGQSAVRDAVELGLSLRAPSGVRPLMILFSDGIDNASWITDEEAIASARTEGMVIDVVRVPVERDPMPTLLDDLTKATGGRIFPAKADRDFEELFAQALDEMRSPYLLTFAAKRGQRPGWHNLTVKLRSGRADIRARPGYFDNRAAP